MSKNEPPKTPPADSDKVGYGKPPAHSQFKKGKSGNPKGRPKQMLADMSVNRIICNSLSGEVRGLLNGKTRKMTKLAAIVEVQAGKALKGDTRAAKLIIDLGRNYIPAHQTLEDLMRDRPVYSFTEEERARWAPEKLMEGVVFSDSPKKDDQPPKEDENPPQEDDQLAEEDNDTEDDDDKPVL